MTNSTNNNTAAKRTSLRVPEGARGTKVRHESIVGVIIGIPLLAICGIVLIAINLFTGLFDKIEEVRSEVEES